MACPALEQQYSPQELAEIWGVNEQTSRCMVAADPGILRINVRRISPGAQREMLPLPLALVAHVAPVASQAFFIQVGFYPALYAVLYAEGNLESVGKLGWAEGFEPSATGTTIRRSTKLSYAHRKGTPQFYQGLATTANFETAGATTPPASTTHPPAS